MTLRIVILLIAGLLCLPAAERKLQNAIERGLEALVDLQAADGSIGNGAGITSLSAMALLSGGHTPTRGLYHEQSARCLNFILGKQDSMSGYLGTDHGRMYSHGFATLYLAECYGMTPNKRVRNALEAALELIYRSQNDEGGWRYDPTPTSADISVTVCQINAIRAAYNVGIGGERSQSVTVKALEYVRACHRGNGSFSYMRGQGGNWGTRGSEGVPRSAAGAMSLIGAGVNSDTDPVLGPSLKFLRTHVKDHLHSNNHYFWYGQYYASQALFHSPERTDWDKYWAIASRRILELQDKSGAWTGPDGNGTSYNTAMALIILQIPNNYLPIFQR